MASLAKRERKQGWSYELRWRENNKNRRLCLDTQNKRAANLALKQLKQKLLEKKFTPIEKEQLTISQFRDQYLEYRKPRRAEKTVESDMYALQSIERCLGDIYINSITTSLIEDKFITTRLSQVKPGSVNNEIRHLKAAFNYAVEREYVELNPFQRIKQLKVESVGEKFFTVDDLKKIEENINREDDRQLMWFLILTGLRIGELLSLQWSSIHFDQRIIKVRGKGNKVRIVGINEDLLELIHTIPRYDTSDYVFPGMRNAPGETKEPFGQRSYSRIARRFKAYFQKSGVDGTLHKFRHTFASQMLMRGVGERAVQLLMGHESITTTEIYSHLSMDFLSNVMNVLKISDLRGETIPS